MSVRDTFEVHSKKKHLPIKQIITHHQTIPYEIHM